MSYNFVFRFDDISLNTDAEKLDQMILFLKERFSSRCIMQIMLAVSPAIHDMARAESLERERVFPSMLHTESDFRAFYQLDKAGVPPFIEIYRNRPGFQIAAHGLVHVDHRLLSKSAQELSILTSCSLLKTRTFVPPFHKWNKKTEKICREHKIQLVSFQPHLWKHLKYHPFSPHETNYYLHTHDLTYEQFVERFPQTTDR